MEENKNFEETIEKVEKKTLKEVIAENKGKILAGVSCAIVGVGGYQIYKHGLQIKINTKDIDFVRDVVKEGALEEAIVTVNRKINYRMEKIAHLRNSIEDNGPELISKYEEELKELIKKQKAFVAEYDSIAIK